MTLSERAFSRDVRDRLFHMDGDPLPDRIGLEMELLPLRLGDHGVPSIRGSGGSLEYLSSLADDLNWVRADAGAHPRFRAPCGCRVSFEPGGQIEVSSPTSPSVDRAVGCIRAVLTPINDRAAEAGLRMAAWGIDRLHPAEETTLELPTPRYRRLAAHFERFGMAGRRMMRQTCALHVNLDLGPDPVRRWRAANILVPGLTAVFANSSVYAGSGTGFRSFRSWQWRSLDPSRCGIPGPGKDPAHEYRAFAIDAAALLLGPESAPSRPFRMWLDEGGLQDAQWRGHLSTLFPEVRPRGYLEIRSIDALPLDWLGVPATIAAGCLYDERSLEEVLSRFPFPTENDLREAAREGLGHALLRARAEEIYRLGVEGSERLGGALASPVQLQVARTYYDYFTARGLDPGGG